MWGYIFVFCSGISYNAAKTLVKAEGYIQLVLVLPIQFLSLTTSGKSARDVSDSIQREMFSTSSTAVSFILNT